MKVLVTGGSGFIGSHVVDRLIAHGHSPRIFDLAPSPHHPADAVETILGSVTDAQEVAAALRGCDAVIHLAAVADVAHVHDGPERAEHINARGTLNVLQAAKTAGVGRVLYGSTIWVYSDSPDAAVDEDSACPPPSHLYTATKLAGELYCRSYAELYGLDCTILRFGIPYGPRARPAAVVPAFVEKALAGEPLTIAGDGSQGRRFVYVEDLADGVVRALAPVAVNRTYNLAGEETTTIRGIAETVREQLGDVRIETVPARAGDFSGKEVSIARAREELGWRPTTTFAEGVRRYIAWRRSCEEPAPGAGVVGPDVPRRVLILSADIGEGHDLPARMVAREIEDECPQTEVTILDGLQELGRVAHGVVHDGSERLLRRAAWLFEIQYFLLCRLAPTRWLAQRLIYAFYGRRVLRIVHEQRADAVVSTYPGLTFLIGELRRRGRLGVPAYSSITDLAALQFWSHPGIDLHFLIHAESAPEVEAIAGPGSTRWARPPTDRAFLAPRARREARRDLGLPEGGRIVVVSGGGWAVGDLDGAIRTALDVPGATVVCLAGRSERVLHDLGESFGDEPRVRILGFTDRMSDLLAAADVLIHATAGLTVLEALIRGCSVISYGFGVGHIRLNNRAYRRLGIARVARTRAQLAAALEQSLADAPLPDQRYAGLPSTASFVLRRAERVAPVPSRRPSVARVAATAAAVVVIALLALSTDFSYPLVAWGIGARPTTTVPTSRTQVGLLVDAPQPALPAIERALARRQVKASLALTGLPSPAALAALRRTGQEALPRLGPGAPVHWLRTRGAVRQLARGFGFSGRFLYAAPRDGFTLGEYLMARFADGHPIRGAERYTAVGSLGAVRRGDIVEVVPSSVASAAALVAGAVDDLRARGLEPVAVSRLLGGRAQ